MYVYLKCFLVSFSMATAWSLPVSIAIILVRQIRDFFASKGFVLITNHEVLIFSSITFLALLLYFPIVFGGLRK